MPRVLHIIYAMYIPAPNIFSREQCVKWVPYKVRMAHLMIGPPYF